MIRTFLVNTAWMLSCRSSLQRFNQATQNVAATQQQLLSNVLSSNAQSDFGQTHQFDQLETSDAFRNSISIGDYESFEPWIERIARGEHHVLTMDPVELLEPTSGSAGARKLIPYTDSLRRQFRCAIDAWIGDLFWMRPALRSGRAYWSITPNMDQQTTAGGLKIGFDEDTEYLGLAGRLAARCVIAVGRPQLRGVRVEDTLRETMRHLIAVKDLSLISVWSPTFLISLLRLLQDEPQWLETNLPESTPVSLRIHIQSVLRSRASIAEKSAALWPQLALISCWTDGAAAGFARQLHELLPDVEIQPKGLISTEAFVSLPMITESASALAIRSHFFEFSRIDEPTERTYLAHELSQDQCYRVIITTAGGLYRYRSGDIISVVGFRNECPLIRFVGRGESVSDLVGEKLNDAFVSLAIANTMQRLGLQPSFACLVPINQHQPHYCLRVDAPQNRPIDCVRLQAAMESELSANPYYEHATRIGQLGPVEISLSEPDGPSHWQDYQARRLKAGVRRGDIKPLALETPNF